METQALDFLENGAATEHKTYQITLLSPMAVHGYKKPDRKEKHKTAEFRISSLRGVLRYWWRALQGENALLSEEEQLFGGVHKKSVASPVLFSVSKRLISGKPEKMLPHKKQGPSFPAITAGTQLQIDMFVKRNHNLDYYAHLFHLVSLLGSIGQRSRRGFGAFQLENIDSIDDFKEEIINDLKYLKVSGVSEGTGGCLIRRNVSVNDHPQLSAVYIGKAFASPNEITKSYGDASHEAAYSTNGALGSIDSKKDNKKKKLSSPLWGSMKKIGDAYYPVITELKSAIAVGNTGYEEAKKIFLQGMGVDHG